MGNRTCFRATMPDLTLLPAFILASAILIAIPGPNMALIVANSVAYGPRYGLLTVAGTSAATMLQLAITGLGMTELLAAAGQGVSWLRWAGVAYLLWIGVAQWRAPPTDFTRTAAQPRSPRIILGRAVLVALTNPKTLLFYSAFFPQFIAPGPNPAAQIAILAATFFVIAVTLDSVWALLAGHARQLLGMHGRLRNRVTGALLMGAGIGLAFARPK